MMDDRKAEATRTFLGHSGPVYRCSFSFDRSLLLSCSEDSTLRLWSLQTWTCLVVYKGHCHPVWDVRFSPHGHYFVSCSHDRTARVWTTDSPQPLRVFVGHLTDVDVSFHYLIFLIYSKLNFKYFSAVNSIPTQITWRLVPVTEQCVFGMFCPETTFA